MWLPVALFGDALDGWSLYLPHVLDASLHETMLASSGGSISFSEGMDAWLMPEVVRAYYYSDSSESSSFFLNTK